MAKYPPNNEYETHGNITYLHITRRNGDVYTCLIDTDDLPKVIQYRWCIVLSKPNYPRVMTKTGGNKGIPALYRYLHRVVTEANDSVFVDHISCNTLDNRKSNLRFATNAENMQNLSGLSCSNTSGARGVSWDKSRGKWEAYASLNGRRKHLGRYATKHEAAIVASKFRADNMPFSIDAREAA